MMKKGIISRIYRLFVIASLLIGIILNIARTTSVAAILSYYTLQSNIVCLVAFVGIEIASILKKRYQDNDIYYLIKGSITIIILITAIVYAVALFPNGFQMDSLSFNLGDLKGFLSNFLVHQLSPILVILDYFLFDKKGKFKFYYPLIWVFIPLNYLVYVYTYSPYGGVFFGIGGSEKFGYVFLDYTLIGYLGVVETILFMAFVVLVISFLFVLLDRKLGKKHTGIG